jgi:serine/threonine protein kinase
VNNRTVDRCDYNVGEYINNRYRVSQTLGEGSFGKVYRVTDSASKDYALKLLRLWEVPPEIRKPLMERFEMEFKTGQIELLAKRFNVTTENLLSGDEVHYNKTVVHCMNEFQNPKNREEVLDFIDDYMDIFDAINQNKKK